MRDTNLTEKEQEQESKKKFYIESINYLLEQMPIEKVQYFYGFLERMAEQE